MSAYETLTDVIISRAMEDSRGITFILDDTGEIFVSYKDVYHTSLGILYHLQEAGFKKGDEVIFQIEDNRNFIYSFWACMLGGMIPVPVTTGANDEHKLKLFKIWNVLSNPRLIATSAFVEKLEAFASKNDLQSSMELIRERTFCIDTPRQDGGYGEICMPQPGDMAFIQFSSGSTGDPKGVIITHRNALVNIHSMAGCARIRPEDSNLSWMPLTHDMGLVGTHITSVLMNINQYNMQTQLFIRHPTLWIQKASEYRATMLYSPNFGYMHFLKFFSQEHERDWDLSQVRLIVNGAEPISVELCNEFLDRLEGYGLRRNAMYTVYGLAEATLGVAFPHPGEAVRAVTLNRDYLGVGEAVRETAGEDSKGVTFVDVGYPIDNCAVRICDEENRILGENRVGYIQIQGENVTRGYYNNTVATERAITPDGWLNTGDLGLMREGRLIVTGRAKDVIFVAGQNYYSHDIERVAEQVEGIELGKVAAVGVFNEARKCDELVLFVLSKQKSERFIPIATSLKRVISQRLGIEATEVIPVKNIPKTTSGKVQRYKLREGYMKGEYDTVKREIHALAAKERDSREIDNPANALQEELVKIWSEVLNVPRVGIRDNFFALGGDSLRAVQLLSRVREAFGVEMEQTELFENAELLKQAEFIEKAERKRPGGLKCTAGSSSHDGPMPLSSGQQRLFFLDRLNMGSSQYNLYAALRLGGGLDRDALVKSLNEIMRRHRVLKASFIEEKGQPLQVYNQDAALAVSYTDLSHEPERERERAVLEMAGQEASKPFDLGKAPLIRCRLFTLEENEHILVLVVHHIVFDGWSFGILLKELSFYYEAFSGGKAQILPEPEIQYTDFALWQAGRLEEERVQKQLAYWRGKLSGGLAVLDLPVDRQRPAVQSFRGAKLTNPIPPELVKKLKDLAGNGEATLFMVLLAAFKLLLYRYTSQQDMVVGSPIANRNVKELEGAIGFFTNNLVLRTGISPEDSFLGLLQKVKRVTLEALANQDVPFEKLVEVLQVERDMSRNPLFQVLFSLQNTPLPELGFAEIQVSAVDIDSKVARFDLSLDIRETGEGLAADFEYNTDLFNEDTICRMAGHYRRLLEGVVEEPGRRLDAYDILTRGEQDTILKEWNSTDMDFGDISCWTRLFESWAGESPNAVAVEGAGKSLTYGELNRRANGLAHYLESIGAGPESIIGVYMDRTVDMLTALVAVHKAGGAYLPMDPIFPAERLAYMLEDAQAGIILTEKALADTLPANQARVICLDSAWAEIESCSSRNMEPKSGPGSLAYLIYTSGSTGKPKGVQIEQRALVNFLLSMAKETGMTVEDALLAVTTLSFDIAGLELFMPLTAGGKVVLAGREEVTDGSRLAAMLEEYGITFMQATPATWRLLMESGWKGRKGLKALCGGEALPRDLAAQLLDRCAILWNVYGPTETTIWSTIARVEREDAISIGKAIANTRVYVLDRGMKPVPAGIPGELYIGGSGVARGYLNRPELTAEKFIPDPFINCQLSTVDCQLLYRTGDHVKFLPDGSLEFVGRMDHQVKIRGFRIELGEIEALLNRNAAVKESVVAVKEIISGQKSLVAYIIPAPGADPSEIAPDALRRSLREKLPDYMIPAAFVTLDSFPMTPNRKIDRKVLPMPESLRPQLETGYVPPSNETEKSITAIWQEVLKLDVVGVNDNFFDLGGHSLLLAKVRSGIKERLNKDVSMMDLFKYPTIHTLSRHLDGEEAPGPEDSGRSYKEGPGASKGDIAVIGLSGRFPGAANVEEFWKNLCNGVESIARFTENEVLSEGVDPEALKKPDYVKAWGVLEGADKFDAVFFGYNPGEAEVLDPQQRVFLEESWKALENAGYDSEKYRGLIGVFASTGMNGYVQNLTDRRASRGLAGDYQIMISNDKDFLATRVAYKLGLEGPGVTVQTACSSSLVAVHMACRSLQNGECDMALAGGVSIRLPQKAGYLYQEGMILSPDGHCRAFDEQAKGTVGGNGAGVVVLKRLEDALADGDTVSAVIKGSVINNDGALKIGYTAPRVDGQSKAIAEAQARAGVDVETISYIEAHGTGTPLGDPIEIEALTQAFNRKTNKRGFCAIGSVKTNIGHLDAAAGVTGLIKTILSLRHKMLPPSLNYAKPNPRIDFENSPFFVNGELREWKNGGTPLRAGVSSFGIGGTNAHVVLEEAPEVESDAHGGRQVLLVFSAKTGTALNKLTANFADFLKKNPDINMADTAYTLQTGRRELECRSFVVCASREDAVEALERENSGAGRVQSSPAGQGPGREIDPASCSLEELGHLWLSGVKIDWSRLYAGQKRKRIPLPAYPFEGKSYWVSREKEREKPLEKAARREALSEWFYVPVWKQCAGSEYFRPLPQASGEKTLLVLTGTCDFANKLVQALREDNENVFIAATGKEYKRLNDGTYLFNPGTRDDYDSLLKDVEGTGRRPGLIINLLGVNGENVTASGETLFYSMLYLAQAMGAQGWNTPVVLKALVNGSQKICGEKELQPEKALLAGPCRVIPREYPNVRCSSIDFILPVAGSPEEQEMIEQLITEIHAEVVEDTVAYRSMERWVLDYEKTLLPEGDGMPAQLKQGGVYLITGGLGGIGLALAEYLAREAQARLVLFSRSGFPEKEGWEQWLAAHGPKDETSRKIRKLQYMESLGAKVLICRGDVTDLEQVKAAVEKAEQSLGKINGVIHAAGNPGGGMIQLKKREFAENVLFPKVRGTMVLYEALKERKPDFFILCSSLNAVTGGFGQVDYSAANAFLDAFAQAHHSPRGTRVISINWDRWPGVGMAANGGGRYAPGREEIHPLLGRKIEDTHQKAVYMGELSPEKDWVLSEHLVMGTPTIAGTTYLEMVRAAVGDDEGRAPEQVEITEVIFLMPMAVREGEKRDVFTLLDRDGSGAAFRIISRPHGDSGEKARYQEHVRGRIAVPEKEEEAKAFDLQALGAGCSARTIDPGGEVENPGEEFISFGKRWKSLNKLYLGDSEGLAEIELDEEFAADLGLYKLHPALLDAATGSVRLAAGGNYLPFSYERLVVKGPLPRKLYGYIRFKNGYTASQEIITSDIDILNEHGIQVAEIKGFSMRLTGESAASGIRKRASGGEAQLEFPDLDSLISGDPGKDPDILNEGITPAEGQEILGRILQGCFKPRVVVSVKDIGAAIAQADYISRPKTPEAPAGDAPPKVRHPRPELDSAYVAPKNEDEKKLAGLWQDMLGIDRVGIHDEFFELGGDSLLLIQFHSKLKESFKTDIAVVDLYKYNTVASLAKYLAGDYQAQEQPVFQEVNRRAGRQMEIMKQRRLQMSQRKGAVNHE